MQQIAGYEVVKDLPGRPRERCFRARPAGSRAKPAYLVRRPEDGEADRLLASAAVQQKLTASRARYWAAVYAQGRDDEGAYVVTDYHRRSAEWLIQQSVELKHAGLYRIVSCIVAGLRELKRTCARAHGNLQPANVLISGRKSIARDRIVLCDPAPDDMSGSAETLDDFRALGRLIFELTAHSHFNELDDFPVAPRRFEKLGKHASAWRQLCSDLLDPDAGRRLSDLDELQRRLKALKPRSLRIPITALLVLLLGGGLGFAGWKKFPFHPEVIVKRDAEADRKQWQQLCADYRDLEGFIVRVDESRRQAVEAFLPDVRGLSLQNLERANPKTIAQKTGATVDELGTQWEDQPQSRDEGVGKTKAAVAIVEQIKATRRQWDDIQGPIDYLEKTLQPPPKITSPNLLATALSTRLFDIVSAAKNWHKVSSVDALLQRRKSIDADRVVRLCETIGRLATIEQSPLSQAMEQALRKRAGGPTADLDQLESAATAAEKFALELRKVPPITASAAQASSPADAAQSLSPADAQRFEARLLACLESEPVEQIGAALKAIQDNLSALNRFQAESVAPLGTAFDAPFRRCGGLLLSAGASASLKSLSENIAALAADARQQTQDSLKGIADWRKTPRGAELAGALDQSANAELKDAADFAKLGAGLKHILSSVDQIERSSAQIQQDRTSIANAARTGIIGGLPNLLESGLKPLPNETLPGYAGRAADLQSLANGWTKALADKEIDLDILEQENRPLAGKSPDFAQYKLLLARAPTYRQIPRQTVTDLLQPVEKAKAALRSANITDPFRARADELLKMDLSGGWTEATKADRLKAMEALCKKLGDLKQEIELGNYGSWRLAKQNLKFQNSAIESYWAKMLPVCAPPATPGEPQMKKADRLATLLQAFAARMNQEETQPPRLSPDDLKALAADESAMRATVLSETLKSLGEQLPNERACDQAENAFDAQLTQVIPSLIKDHANMLAALQDWPALAGEDARTKLLNLYDNDEPAMKGFGNAAAIARIRSRVALLKQLAGTPDADVAKWWATSAGSAPSPELLLVAWIKLARAPRTQFSDLAVEKTISDKLGKILTDASALAGAKELQAKIQQDRLAIWAANFRQAGSDDVEKAIGTLQDFCGSEEKAKVGLPAKALYGLALFHLKRRAADTNLKKEDFAKALDTFGRDYQDLIAQGAAQTAWFTDAERAEKNETVSLPGADWPLEYVAKDATKLQWGKSEGTPRRRKLSLKFLNPDGGASRKNDTLEFVYVASSGAGETYLCTTEVSLGSFIDVAEAANAWGRLAASSALPMRQRNFDEALPICAWMSSGPAIARSSGWLRGLVGPEGLKRLQDQEKFARNKLGPLLDAPKSDHPMQYLSPPGAEQFARIVGCRLPTVSEWQAAWAIEKADANVHWNLRGKKFAAMMLAAEDAAGSFGALNSIVTLQRTYDSGSPASIWASQLDRPAPAGNEYASDTMPFAPVDEPDAGKYFKHLRGNIAEYATAAAAIPSATAAGAAATPQYFIVGGSSLSRPQKQEDNESWFKGKPIKGDPSAAHYADVGVRLACTFPHMNPRDLVLRAKYLSVR